LNKTIAKTQDFGLTERVIFTGSIGDSDLKVLLNQANLFVIPSLSEGFGLSGLEAMACGCPVASSNLTSLPEVYGEAAIYFNPLSVKSISEAVNKVLGSKKIAGELIKKGQEQVRKYSWEKMAKETLEIYKEINV
jgi:glycosyltransferase involved in cell wall biosynthesis